MFKSSVQKHIFCKVYPSWIKQSQLIWPSVIGMSEMCSTSDMVLCVKKWLFHCSSHKVKWASSILHLFPDSAFEQLNPVSWRNQADSFTDGSEWLTVPYSCSLVLSNNKANHSLRIHMYTWPAMGRLIRWEDRWAHKHREDKQQPDCIPQYLSLQCSGKTLCQGSLRYLPSQVLVFQISGPQTQSHQPTSPPVFLGADPRIPWSFQYIGLSPCYSPADLSWTLLMGPVLTEQGAHSHRKHLETGFRQDKIKVIWQGDEFCQSCFLTSSFLHTVDLIYSLPHPLCFPPLVLCCHPWSPSSTLLLCPRKNLKVLYKP